MKKLDFGVGKENMPTSADVSFEGVSTKTEAKVEKKEVDTSLVAPGIKPEEMDEPLLRANPQRFVLFPIKYHEVSLHAKPLYASLQTRFLRVKCTDLTIPL